MNKIIIKIFLFLIFWSGIKAQTTDLGTPKSWTLKEQNTSIETHKMPSFDLDARLLADAQNELNKIGPWRFGYEFPVNLNIHNSGSWTTLPNGDRIWRIRIKSEGALSLNFIFDQFFLPAGANVYIYRTDRQEYVGAYTHKNNNQEEMLGSMPMQGSDIIVEYFEPYSVKNQGKFSIGTVIHGYRKVSVFLDALKGLNSSDNCNYDVNCPLGNGWQNEINAVALMMSGGSSFCTGALINNTAEDGTPYFLTANHCLGGNPATWVFRFNWDSPNPVCGQNQNSTDPGEPYNDVNGAVLKAKNADSDFGLLELNSIPTGNVYYAGWNRSTTPATEVTAIHHPRGDIKKISRENNTVSTASWSGASSWKVSNWDLGTTEPGSSGSPLFNQNHHIVGQLYGGTAACSGLTNNGDPDYYGRLDVSWTGGGSSTTRLKDWLDPTNSNAMTLDGYDPTLSSFALDAGIQSISGFEDISCNQSSFFPEVNIRNFGVSDITSATITYNIDGMGNNTYTWTGTLTPSNYTNVILPSVSVSAEGNHTFYATVTSPNGQLDSNSTNNTSSQRFITALNSNIVNMSLLTDCWGRETSWLVYNSIGTVVARESGYTSGSPRLYTHELCLPTGCYTLIISDSQDDGLFGSSVNGCGVDGNYYIVNEFGDSLVVMGDPDFGSRNTHDFCVSSEPSAVNEEFATDYQLNVFPNPNSGKFNVELSLDELENVTFQVYNNLGQLLYQEEGKKANKFTHHIDLSPYSTGLYYLKVQFAEQSLVRKIIKN